MALLLVWADLAGVGPETCALCLLCPLPPGTDGAVGQMPWPQTCELLPLPRSHLLACRR